MPDCSGQEMNGEIERKTVEGGDQRVTVDDRPSGGSEQTRRQGAAMKLLYKPFGQLIGVIGGLLAGALFKRLWRGLRHEDEAPTATTANRSWTEVLVAAALEGAVYALVKAALERFGATTYAGITGVWPDESERE
jgi:hypothetical protein